MKMEWKWNEDFNFRGNFPSLLLTYLIIYWMTDHNLHPESKPSVHTTGDCYIKQKAAVSWGDNFGKCELFWAALICQFTLKD
jgi:hypothetical protein